MRRVALAVVVTCLALPGAAGAHSGAAFGTHPFVEDGELIGGGTDYGMLIVEDGVPLWTCEEAFVYEPNWWYRAPGGPTLAGTFEGLYRSTDGGCTWIASTGPLGEATNISAVGSDPDDPTHIWVTTADGATTNRVWESTDSGLTFEETGWADDGIKPRGIGVAPGGQALYVLAIRESDAATLLYGSTDGGVTWTDPLELTGWAIPIYLGLSTDLGSVYIEALQQGGDQFWLLRVDAGMKTPPVQVASFPSPINAYVEFEGKAHLIEGWTRYHVDDGITGTFTEVEGPEIPTRCLSVIDGRLYSCGLYPCFAQFAVLGDDGVTWEPLIGYEEVVPRDCPTGSRADSLCPPIWDLIAPAPAGDDDDSAAPDPCTDPPADDDDATGDDDDAVGSDDDDATGPDDDDDSAVGGTCDGCAAAGTGSGGGAAAALVLLLASWRGRRSGGSRRSSGRRPRGCRRGRTRSR